MLDIKNPIEARKVIRKNEYRNQTAGTANKYVQGNLCILPSKYAMDFASFCQKNPKPCPLIGFGTKGDPSLKDLGDIDIRTDVPQYRIWEKGKIIDEPYDIKKYWKTPFGEREIEERKTVLDKSIFSNVKNAQLIVEMLGF